MAGINTLLQALFGTRLPAVVGGSFAYVIPIAHIIGDSHLQRISDPQEVSHLLFPFSLFAGSLGTNMEINVSSLFYSIQIHKTNWRWIHVDKTGGVLHVFQLEISICETLLWKGQSSTFLLDLLQMNVPRQIIIKNASVPERMEAKFFLKCNE